MDDGSDLTPDAIDRVMAIVADWSERLLSRLDDLPSWSKLALWVLLFPFVMAMTWIVARPTSRVAHGVLAGLLVLVPIAVVTAPDDATTLAPVAVVDVATPRVTASTPGPTRPPTTRPTPAPSRTRSPSPSPTPRPTIASPTETEAPGPTSTATTTTAAPLPQPLAAGPRGDTAPVVRQGRVTDVVDGDTFVMDDGTRVRIAIVDTPEVGQNTEPCGVEATDFTAGFVAGQVVAIFRPANAPALDPFDRLLGEVVRVSDGASLNVALVAAGLGRVDERFTSEDPDLAARARAATGGAATPTCAASQEAAPEEPLPFAGGQHTGKTDGGWTCHPAYRECLPDGPDLDCAEVGHEVVLLGNDDPYRLDGRSTSRDDGVGCEAFDPWSPNRTYPYY